MDVRVLEFASSNKDFDCRKDFRGNWFTDIDGVNSGLDAYKCAYPDEVLVLSTSSYKDPDTGKREPCLWPTDHEELC